MKGFELLPSYVEELRPGVLTKILRNLWVISNGQLLIMMLLVWAVVPYSEMQSGPGNILSLLAEHAVQAKWLRYMLVGDAVLVLCAGTSPVMALIVGVLTGIISSCGIIERLSLDHVLPKVFLRRISFSKAPYISIIFFVGVGLAMYGVVDANLDIIAGQFTVSFLVIMGLFALSNCLLKFNRGRLVHESAQVPLPLVLFALVIVGMALVGNILFSPVIAGYFSIFFIITLVAMTYTGLCGKLVTVVYWLYTRNQWLHSYRRTRNWGAKLTGQIRRSKTQPIIFFAKTDEANTPKSKLIG